MKKLLHEFSVSVEGELSLAINGALVKSSVCKLEFEALDLT